MESPIRFIEPAEPPTVRVVAPHHAEGCSLIAPHWPYRATHLSAVEEEMIARGGPRIRAWWDGEHWRAIEGSHRIAVAARTRHVIHLEEVAPDYEFDHDQPSVGRITVERMIRERIGGSTALYTIEPWPAKRLAVVLGGASSLHRDLEDLSRIVELEACVIVAVNDAGRDYAGRIDHWATLHPERLPAWVRMRALRIGRRPRDELRSRDYVVWSDKPHHLVDRRRASIGGSSGLFAVLRVVVEDLMLPGALCGIPLDPREHFDRPGPWLPAEGLQPVWTDHMHLLLDRVRSLSGWTREQLGEPTREWVRQQLA